MDAERLGGAPDTSVMGRQRGENKLPLKLFARLLQGEASMDQLLDNLAQTAIQSLLCHARIASSKGERSGYHTKVGSGT